MSTVARRTVSLIAPLNGSAEVGTRQSLDPRLLKEAIAS